MYKLPGEMAELNCSHSIQGYDQILWYKRASSGHLQLMGHMVESSGFIEANLSVEINGNAKKNEISTLSVGSLSSDSSAVYFCAASYHSVICHSAIMQKHSISKQKDFVTLLK